MAGKAAADAFARNVLPVVRELQAAGVKTSRAIADALNARGIPDRARWGMARQHRAEPAGAGLLIVRIESVEEFYGLLPGGQLR